VARQTVHWWLRRYANDGGLGGLADRSSRPESCPHQMPPAVEARVLWIRGAHPAWGPSRIVWQWSVDATWARARGWALALGAAAAARSAGNSVLAGIGHHAISEILAGHGR
jgi:Homeodomain-like domain